MTTETGDSFELILTDATRAWKGKGQLYFIVQNRHAVVLISFCT